ncbi:polysaccharide biosynthesis protein [Planomicrobium sp. YIM 101495]|uniref:putative polysaccharide biosynthesis protein n=1 Tax=Planomicrobium sp. YIM 101495 TaxID=2665160 RepID=UPI0012B97E2D|nr:polysaccharide biosynthesis protein [Planomicrobium sp. YIM 101495]MTD32166.1 oligosaccharide flippase family protein [Planomicrobium sp. YIM 101495]
MKKFMQGAVWLAMAGILVKLLSALYRVPFQNMVGDQGFYIYQQIYPFVGIFAVWTTYGLAVAVSKLLADHDPSVHRAIEKTALGFLMALSILWFAMLYFGSDRLAHWMGDPVLAPLLKTGAFAALFMPVAALVKGRLQAAGQMQPIAVAQVGEQMVRVAVILIGTWIVLAQGGTLYHAGQTAIFGAVAGGAAAVLFLLPYRRPSFDRLALKNGATIKRYPIIKQLAAISISISVSSLILLLFQLVDSFTVFRLLTESGTERMTAMEQKGVYDRAQPLVQFGIVIASSLVLSIVPLVAEMKKKNDLAKAATYAALSYRMSFLFAAAAAGGLTAVMPYVNEMLFGSRTGSFALIVFSWQIIWLSLSLVLTSLLQGIGKLFLPVLWLLAGLGLKVVGNALLIPLWGITGAATAGNIGLALSAIGLFISFKRHWSIRFAPLRYYGWLLFATIVMVAGTTAWATVADRFVFGSGRTGASLTALTAVPFGAIIFLTIIATSRVITERQWYSVPLGRKMAAFQLKLRSNRQKRGIE